MILAGKQDYLLNEARKSNNKVTIYLTNGTQLIARSFTSFLKEWNMKHIRTAVRYPETNGEIEVLHKTTNMKMFMSKSVIRVFMKLKRTLQI